MNKRYFQIDNHTIVDKSGNDNNWIYYFYRDGKVTFYCKNPEIKFHQEVVSGKEADSLWADLLDRVNNINNPNYYRGR